MYQMGHTPTAEVLLALMAHLRQAKKVDALWSCMSYVALTRFPLDPADVHAVCSAYARDDDRFWRVLTYVSRTQGKVAAETYHVVARAMASASGEEAAWSALTDLWSEGTVVHAVVLTAAVQQFAASGKMERVAACLRHLQAV